MLGIIITSNAQRTHLPPHSLTLTHSLPHHMPRSSVGRNMKPDMISTGASEVSTWVRPDRSALWAGRPVGVRDDGRKRYGLRNAFSKCLLKTHARSARSTRIFATFLCVKRHIAGFCWSSLLTHPPVYVPQTTARRRAASAAVA